MILIGPGDHFLNQVFQSFLFFDYQMVPLAY